MSEEVTILSSNVLRLHALAAFADELGRDGVSVVVLKGAALLGREYPTLSQRAMCDVDVLVRARDWDRAQAALHRIGARERGIAAGRPATRDAYYEAAYLLPVGESVVVPIDLHRRLTWSAAFPIDAEELFEGAQPHPMPDLADKGVLRLRPEHLLLHLALHRFQHQYDGDARNYEDAARLVALPGLDRGRLLEVARRWGLQTVLYAFLDRGQLAGIIAGVEDLIQELRPSRFRCAALRFATGMTSSSRAKQLALFWSCCHRSSTAIGFPLWYVGLRVTDVARRFTGI